jgi:hypothetical protein
MLKDPAEREPDVMRRIFKQPPPARDVGARRTGDLATLAAQAGSVAMPEATSVSDAVDTALRRQADKKAGAHEEEASLL